MNPYTHNEKQITLFSETDIDGIIIRVNDAFCDVSKYSRNELIGKSHNIIRHPDMPKKLFEELWRTIRMGGVFRGVIKNRACDNSHYWVKATIMPTTNRNNEIVKYIGVRHLIADDKVAEELFAIQSR
jgi:PAS domain S-box-containing protein